MTIAVNDELKKDVEWFSKYAARCNGRLLIRKTLPIMEIECDACPSGAGGFSDSHYYSIVFPRSLAETHHISRLEAANVILAIKSLVPVHIRNMEVIVTTDNSATMYAPQPEKQETPCWRPAPASSGSWLPSRNWSSASATRQESPLCWRMP